MLRLIWPLLLACPLFLIACSRGDRQRPFGDATGRTCAFLSADSDGGAGAGDTIACNATPHPSMCGAGSGCWALGPIDAPTGGYWLALCDACCDPGSTSATSWLRSDCVPLVCSSSDDCVLQKL